MEKGTSGLVMVLAVLGFLTTIGGLWRLLFRGEWGMVVALPLNVVFWWWLIAGAVRRQQLQDPELRS